jgi:hypothetical protein
MLRGARAGTSVLQSWLLQLDWRVFPGVPSSLRYSLTTTPLSVHKCHAINSTWLWDCLEVMPKNPLNQPVSIVQQSGKQQRYIILSEPPNPHMLWYFVPSLITMSASPITEGVVKSIEGEGLREVKSFERSHVVCHYQFIIMCETKKMTKCSRYPKSAVQKSVARRARVPQLKGALWVYIVVAVIRGKGCS